MTNDTKFELSLFEDLLYADFNPLHIQHTLKTRNPEKLKTEIAQETIRIIREFKNVMCKGYEEIHLERYIQTHQRHAIKLIDLLQQHDLQMKTQEVPAVFTEVYSTMLTALETILNYIEKELSKYFDLNLPVPEGYRMVSAELLKQQSLVLLAKLRSKDTEPLLQQLIVNYISEHCALETCSYQQLIYAKLFMENMLALLKKNEAEDWNRRILVELIYLNFNCSTFFTYCRRLIAVAVDAEKTYTLQTEKFYWYIKELKQLHIKPNTGYKVSRPGIAVLLENYIAAELAYLAERYRDDTPLLPLQTFTERAEKFDFQLPLSLSVPQLALIAQLFIEVGVFVVEKGQIMTIMKFFAAHVTTIGTERISADSLYKKRTNPEARVKDEIERILLKMVAVLRY